MSAYLQGFKISTCISTSPVNTGSRACRAESLTPVFIGYRYEYRYEYRLQGGGSHLLLPSSGVRLSPRLLSGPGIAIVRPGRGAPPTAGALDLSEAPANCCAVL